MPKSDIISSSLINNKLRGVNENLLKDIIDKADLPFESHDEIYQKLENLNLGEKSKNSFLKNNINPNFTIDKDSEITTKQTDFKELFVDLKIDHFSYANSKTFQLRYLIKDKFFNYDENSEEINFPIFFYCGNEGSIEDFWNNSGYITETLAKKFNALVVFGEHRFFGKSYPFGDMQDKDIQKNQYLTSQQALSDYVELIIYLKNTLNLKKSPVIAFGGSYGGMLSSWARMKFPHVFTGSIASSAPVLLFEDINRIENSFFKIATETYQRYDEKCPLDIRSGFQKLYDIRTNDLIASNPSILSSLNEIFLPCNKIQNSYDIKKLEDSIEDMLITLSQYNYPYETSFIKPTPSEPVKVACEKIANIRNNTLFLKLAPVISNSINFGFSKYNQIDLDSKYKFMYLKAAIDVFYNYTGTEKCLDIGNDNSTSRNNTDGWYYMACTEMIMPMEKNGVSDMFNPEKWNLENYQKKCKKYWEGDVRPNWIFNFYGGRDFEKEINNYSNILYVNGKMDPWNAGCPKISNNPNIIVFEADSAHHLDLRSPNEKDPESITQARKLIEVLIEKWIKN